MVKLRSPGYVSLTNSAAADLPYVGLCGAEFKPFYLFESFAAKRSIWRAASTRASEAVVSVF